LLQLDTREGFNRRHEAAVLPLSFVRFGEVEDAEQRSATLGVKLITLAAAEQVEIRKAPEL